MRSEELRALLAAEEALTESLVSHVATCAECAGIRAAARRFESRIELTMAEVVTDALPESTAAVARSAPLPARRRPSPRIVVSAVVTVVFVAFAVVGVVSTATSISNAVSGSVTGSGPLEQDGEQVDCYLGEPTVEVTVERIGAGAPGAVIAYCIGTVERVDHEREAAVTCARAMAAEGVARLEPSPREADRSAYLGACTYVADLGTIVDAPDSAGTVATTVSTPFGSWDEAAATVTWPVLRPGWLPDRFDLAALQGFAAETDPQEIESVVATYLRNGTHLSIEQFVIADPGAFRIELSIPGDDLDTVSTGQTVVRGHPAFWATGPVAGTRGGPGVDFDTLVLTWAEDKVGYRITTWIDDLDTVRRLAESLGEE